ncbi:MAG: Bug family tripartite tricarboxylate transporter substrate binding protein [Beijerinckiaceae bacterium]
MKRSLLGLVAVLAACAPASAQFYKDKTLTLLVNYGAGGNADTDARLLVRHWPKHIAGTPNVVVQNLPGAGGLRAMNVLGLKARANPDGTIGGFFTVSPTPPLAEDPGLQINMVEDFIPIGGARGWTIAFARKDIPPGLKEPADLAKASKVFLGGYSRASSHDTRLRLALEVLDVPYQAVTGFPAQSDIVKAMLQNEVNMSASSLPGYLALVQQNIIKPGIGIPLWHYDVIGPDGKPAGNPDLLAMGIPLFSEVYQKARGKPASGPKFEALLQLNNIGTSLQRGVFLPRGAPPAAVEALRIGYDLVVKDPAYIAEYEKVNNEKPDAVNAAVIQSVFEAMQKVTPEVRQVIKAAVAE